MSLAPNLTEMVCAVGAADCLVGRSAVCDYPPDEVKNVPVVGNFGAPFLERLLAVEPTLVLEVDLADQAVAGRLQELGIVRQRIVCNSLDDIPRAIEEVGLAVRHETDAKRLADSFRAKLRSLQTSQPPEATRPTVFLDIWPDPLMTAGRPSFVAELVRLAGGRNVADEIDRDYVQVSAEWAISKDPEVILCLNDSPSAQAPLAAYRQRPGWGSVRAVRTGRVYGGFDTKVLLKPGPRLLGNVALLRTALLKPGTDTAPEPPPPPQGGP
ncbi:MAG: hypothetical protein A3K19_33245 [Lentisphaerae bacterium RIFOXYB12_FULL_65_16]|nr:MAG: hypothetical protein A3K18_24060 [Lentisphaerae bacterium RIFOXYA12_64_32]OGV86898.1 MAG: hypothetical protein A3K19_33245 [Lentisphaerae bacterium RIFOXYB12_FULL_65_16]